MNDFSRIPIEIINQILEEFIKQLDQEQKTPGSAASELNLTTSAYTELINLRLISKIWSIAVVPFYFQSISIDDPKRAKVFIDNWNDDLFEPFHCPVRRLTIENIRYSEQEINDIEISSRIDDEYQLIMSQFAGFMGAPRVSMEHSARLIGLLGRNLKTLTIQFRDFMAVSPNLIKAIQTIKDLQSLSISFEQGEESAIYSEDTLSQILSVVPELECLSLIGIPECLNIKPPALSNLRCFSFSSGAYELKEYSRITQTAQSTLKIIELLPDRCRVGGLEPIFEPIKDTLEGLYTLSFTDQLGDVALLNFPNLQVVRSHFLPDGLSSGIHWLHLPIFKNVRTIVTHISSSGKFWQAAARLAFLNALEGVPNLKHMVFTRAEKFECQPICYKLAIPLEYRGIQCHVTPHLTPSEVLELDYKLNTPMK